jgi:hypothetical protein
VVNDALPQRMIVIGFLRNITLVCKERYITESGVGERYRASSAFHSRLGFALKITRLRVSCCQSVTQPLIALCLGFAPVSLAPMRRLTFSTRKQ